MIRARCCSRHAFMTTPASVWIVTGLSVHDGTMVILPMFYSPPHLIFVPQKVLRPNENLAVNSLHRPVFRSYSSYTYSFLGHNLTLRLGLVVIHHRF